MTTQNAGAFAEQITADVLRELGFPDSPSISCNTDDLTDVFRRLLLTGAIRPPANTAVVSEPLTARELSRLAASTLSDAHRAATEELCEDAQDRALALVHVAKAYTELGAAVAQNMMMQPPPKETNDR